MIKCFRQVRSGWSRRKGGREVVVKRREGGERRGGEGAGKIR